MKPNEAVEFCENTIDCAYCPNWHEGEDGWDGYEWR